MRRTLSLAIIFSVTITIDAVLVVLDAPRVLAQLRFMGNFDSISEIFMVVDNWYDSHFKVVIEQPLSALEDSLF